MQDSNITEALWRTAGLPEWMRVSGTPERYISGESSDYEKLVALATLLETFRGTHIQKKIDEKLSLLLGESVALTKDTCESIWQRTAEKFLLGEQFELSLERVDFSLPTLEQSLPENCFFLPDDPEKTVKFLSFKYNILYSDLKSLTSDLSRCIAEIAALHGTRVGVSASILSRFTPPNTYHAEKALASLAHGEYLAPDARALLSAQLLRIVCQTLASQGAPLFIGAEDSTSGSGFLSFAEYMARERILPRIVILTPDSDNEFSRAAYRSAEKYGNLSGDGRPRITVLYRRD